MKSTTIRVHRAHGGARDLLRSYTVVVDGEKVGRLRRGASLEVAVAPGLHRVQVRIDWQESGEWTVELSRGECAEFVCQPGSGPVFDRREYYIDLHPTDLL